MCDVAPVWDTRLARISLDRVGIKGTRRGASGKNLISMLRIELRSFVSSSLRFAAPPKAEALVVPCLNVPRYLTEKQQAEARYWCDLTPFPANCFMATLTPPIEGYIEKVKDTARKSLAKEKLR
ncbi:hypothetical protein NL676_013461 [Syzygium grande]|nr:hypothetical protein NL676_013461 [Syzygium grande]